MPRLKTEFRWATLAEVRAAGADDMAALHWEEIEHHKDASPLDMDWPQYRWLEQKGFLKIGSLWKGGELIGYNSFFLNKPLHHRSTSWAVCDAIWLDPEHRRGWAGVKLIKETERGLRAMGAKVITYAVKPDRNLRSDGSGDSMSQLLRRLGYGAYETSWSKAL